MGLGDDIGAYLDERIAAGDVPGAVAVVDEAGRELAAVARGDAVVVPERIAATVDTIFDLASLTKPLATTLLALMAVEAGTIRLDDPAAVYLDEFDREGVRGITLRHLLTHTSGLPKWVPLYVTPGDPARVVAAIAALPLVAPIGADVLYSDPNFIVLGIALERATGRTLDILFDVAVARPLGLASTGFRPEPSARGRIAASETGNAYERGMAGELAGDYSAWRTDVVWGEVHDGNAHFLGGVAGHAGLFGTAREATRLAEQFLPGGALLHEPATLALVRTNFTPGGAEHRSIGWMLASSPNCSAGPAMPPDAFGHTGFTGTSVWVDPHARRVVTLLTNRTHPTFASPPMTTIRRTLNALAAGASLEP